MNPPRAIDSNKRRSEKAKGRQQELGHFLMNRGETTSPEDLWSRRLEANVVLLTLKWKKQ